MEDQESPWKELLLHRFVEALRFLAPAIHVEGDWGKPHEALDSSFP